MHENHADSSQKLYMILTENRINQNWEKVWSMWLLLYHGMLVGARYAGFSISETADLGFSYKIVSQVYT